MRRNIKALFLAVIMTLSILLSCVPATALEINEGNGEPKVPAGYFYRGISFTDENNRTVYYVSKPDGKYGIEKGFWIDAYGNAAKEPDNNEAENSVLTVKDLPSKYDARDHGFVTAVENQIGATCWAHAAIAALESNAIKQGFCDNTIDLSEYHTVWNSRNGYYEGVSNSRNDGYIAPDLYGMMQNGGTANVAGEALTNFSGAVKEEIVNFTSTDVNALNAEMYVKLKYSSKFLRDITAEQIISVGTAPDKIKSAILEYGGCYLSYVSDEGSYSYLNSKGEKVTAFYNVSSSNDGGHAVELIGWDDNFSKDDFGQDIRPKNDGAWLLKNSWGSDWGDDGFFWMSYEEPSINGVYAVKAGDNEDFEIIHSYSAGGYSKNVAATKAANVFTAQKNEYLTKVSPGGIYSTDYTLKIYKLSSSYSNPEDGQLIYTQTGNFNRCKYVDITGKAELKKGDIFSVVFEGITSCAAEGVNNDYRKFSAKNSESFYYSNGRWLDSNAEGNHNVCINAVAKEIKSASSYKVKFICPGNYEMAVRSNEGRVELPKTAGYDWYFTYNGQPFDGTGVDRNMNVLAHCCKTDGESSPESDCVKEYRCIFCSNEIREKTVSHSFSEVTVTPTVENSGYTQKKCLKCAYEEKTDFTHYTDSACGMTGDKICWQFVNGVLSLDGLGDMPKAESFAHMPWSGFAKEIDKIVVNSGITSVCDYAFSTTSAKEISLPDTLKSIGKYAFADCDLLEQGVIPSSAEKIGEGIYSGCKAMEKITVEEGVTSLNNSVYSADTRENFNLKEVSLPSTLKNLDMDFFNGLQGLESLVLSPKNENFVLADDVLYNKEMTYLYHYPATKKDIYYKVAETVSTIGCYCFADNPYLKYLDLSCEAKQLVGSTVVNCESLQHVIFPKTLMTLNSHAFENTDKIKSVYISSGAYYFSTDWIFSTAESFEYPVIYTNTENSSLVIKLQNENLPCDTEHTKHSYNILSQGEKADCSTECDRIYACECGSFVRYSGKHCYDWVYDKAANCGADGLKHRKCVFCGDITDENTVVPATAKHSFVIQTSNQESLVSPASCTEAAKYCYICRTCGIKDMNRIVSYGEANNHDFSGEVRDNKNKTHSRKCTKCDKWSGAQYCTWQYIGCTPGATCIQSGTNDYECTVCKAQTKVENGIYTGHAMEGKCTFNNNGTHSGYCSSCKQTVSVECTWVANGTVNAADCTCFGFDRYKCSVCSGEKLVQNNIKGAHSYSNGVCTHCGANEPGYSSEKCNCICHKSGISGFIWQIEKLFCKMFGVNKTCKCGKSHY